MTAEEKYDAFRKLYPGSDMNREEHKRFDALVRILLDLPPYRAPVKVGDFIIRKHSKLGPIIKVTSIGGGIVRGLDAFGWPLTWTRDDEIERVQAWCEEPPF